MNGRTDISPQRQRGATLVIALIFLVLLTMLGVTVANNNSLQERMAGNTRQRDLAFQAAEFALKDAETVIGDAASAENIYIQAVIAGTLPLPARPGDLLLNGEVHANDAEYWKSTFDWSGAGSSTEVTAFSATAGDLVAENPRYIIEQMPTAAIANPSPPPATITYHFYRVTARGVGKDSNAAVILQTMYRFP